MHQIVCSEIELVVIHQNWVSFGSSSNIRLFRHTEMRPHAGLILIACEILRNVWNVLQYSSIFRHIFN